jgi:translation initiation factor 3 subunit I
LKGHDRPITEVQFNHDGDLIFSASKDGSIQVWSSENGERLGTYGDTAQVISSSCNGISVNSMRCVPVIFANELGESTRMISAHGNSTVDLWEVETGKKLYTYPHDVSVRAVEFAEGGKSFVSVTDQQLGFNPFIHVYPVVNSRDDTVKPSCQIEVKSGRVSKVIWGHHNQSLVTANEDGSIRIYDTEVLFLWFGFLLYCLVLFLFLFFLVLMI